MKKAIILGMMLLMAFTMQAQKRCVVLDLQIGSNVTEEEIDAISYIFRSNFQPAGYEKLEQALVTRTIREWGYSRTDMTQQQVIKIGRELDANIIVLGYLSKFMDEYSVDIRILDVAMGNTLVNESENFQKSEYRDAMEKTAKKLAAKIGGGKEASPSKNISPGHIFVSSGYTDLGLPSGTIWKDFNATGFYTYNEAVSQFGSRLPSKEQWEELRTKCEWEWCGHGYKVIGPNGKSILLPAGGCRSQYDEVGIYGYYWAYSPNGGTTALRLSFSMFHATLSESSRSNGLSVRLVQNK